LADAKHWQMQSIGRCQALADVYGAVVYGAVVYGAVVYGAVVYGAVVYGAVVYGATFPGRRVCREFVAQVWLYFPLSPEYESTARFRMSGGGRSKTLLQMVWAIPITFPIVPRIREYCQNSNCAEMIGFHKGFVNAKNRKSKTSFG
jgi:hypothetical protein